MMKNILVTGGAGYIGSHACKALAMAGYTPVVYDNMIYGHEWAVKWGPLEKGDILDEQRLKQVIIQYRPLAVMHFAAFAYVGESVQNPAKYYLNNVAGTLNLLRVMVECGVNKLVFSSTCATYGIPNIIPISETHTQQPINPYGSSKLMVEKILQDFDLAYGMRSISLRYFNASGADPDGEIGECHVPETHLIPLVLEATATKGSFISIFGTDYDTHDGTCIRDYIHVSDLAQAHVLALQKLEKGGATNAYNLGNGSGFSVKEVIDAAKIITEKNIVVRYGLRREGDPSKLVGDASRAKRDLGWIPKYSDLTVQLSHAWNWFRKLKTMPVMHGSE